MEKSAGSGVAVAPISRAHRRSFAAGLLSRGLNRALLLTSAISTAAVVALAITDWMIWGRSSLNPLLLLAMALLLAAALTGVTSLRRQSVFGDVSPFSRNPQAVRVSVQNFLFELGLLLALSWIFDSVLKIVLKK